MSHSAAGWVHVHAATHGGHARRGTWALPTGWPHGPTGFFLAPLSQVGVVTAGWRAPHVVGGMEGTPRLTDCRVRARVLAADARAVSATIAAFDKGDASVQQLLGVLLSSGGPTLWRCLELPAQLAVHEIKVRGLEGRVFAHTHPSITHVT